MKNNDNNESHHEHAHRILREAEQRRESILKRKGDLARANEALKTEHAKLTSVIATKKKSSQNISNIPEQQNKGQRYLYTRYHNQDNYVDDQFLSGLVTNANVQCYSFVAMIESSGVVSNQISSLAVLLAILELVVSGEISETTMSILCFFNALLCALVYSIACDTEGRALLEILKDAAAGVVGISLTLAALTPVLRTLTLTYSDDTVSALVIFLFIVHLLSHDYTSTVLSSGSGILSLNAGLFATVLLASRLSSNTLVYKLFILSFEALALIPFLRKSLQRSSNGRFKVTLMTLILLLSSAYLLLRM